MKELYKNWRCVALVVLAFLAFLLAIAESDSLPIFALTKVVSLAICVFCFLKGNKWSREGKVDEITKLNE